MRILITGGGGMLAHDLVQAAGAGEHDVIAVDRAALDITDPYDVAETIEQLRPEVVINCAAYTNVDQAESDEATATSVNGDGAGHLAGSAANAGAWLIHVSSDYVFDGTAREPYREDAPTGPVSAYGRSKLAGERAVAEAAPQMHTIVRSAWLFGTGGPCFPDTILRLAAERPQIKVVADQVGSPTATLHLAEALLTLAERRVPGVVHVTGGGQASWHAFAEAIVAGAGLACEVVPCTTAEFPRPAPRPAFSVLGNHRTADGVPVLPPWQDGLAAYLAARSS